MKRLIMAMFFVMYFASDIRPDHEHEYGPTLDEICASLALPQDIMKVEFANEVLIYRQLRSGRIILLILEKGGQHGERSSADKEERFLSSAETAP